MSPAHDVISGRSLVDERVATMSSASQALGGNRQDRWKRTSADL